MPHPSGSVVARAASLVTMPPLERGGPGRSGHGCGRPAARAGLRFCRRSRSPRIRSLPASDAPSRRRSPPTGSQAPRVGRACIDGRAAGFRVRRRKPKTDPSRAIPRLPPRGSAAQRRSASLHLGLQEGREEIGARVSRACAIVDAWTFRPRAGGTRATGFRAFRHRGRLGPESAEPPRAPTRPRITETIVLGSLTRPEPRRPAFPGRRARGTSGTGWAGCPRGNARPSAGRSFGTTPRREIGGACNQVLRSSPDCGGSECCPPAGRSARAKSKPPAIRSSTGSTRRSPTRMPG